MTQDARREAQKQWNARACGELDGDKNELDYFLRVEEDRLQQQPWTSDYFRYGRFGGKDVLEIGIGQGTDLVQFGKAGARCHGVDITDNHHLLTQRNFTLRGMSVDLRRADATRLPFDDESMDCVYSFGVLHHIPEIERVLCEVHRVLRPGGALMLAVYHKWSAFWWLSKILRQGILRGHLITLGLEGLKATIEDGADGRATKPFVRLYTRGEIRKLLEWPGFVIDDVSIHQLYADHVLPAFMVRMLKNKPLPLGGVLGWYVTAIAHKTDS